MFIRNNGLRNMSDYVAIVLILTTVAGVLVALFWPLDK